MTSHRKTILLSPQPHFPSSDNLLIASTKRQSKFNTTVSPKRPIRSQAIAHHRRIQTQAQELQNLTYPASTSDASSPQGPNLRVHSVSTSSTAVSSQIPRVAQPTKPKPPTLKQKRIRHARRRYKASNELTANAHFFRDKPTPVVPQTEQHAPSSTASTNLYVSSLDRYIRRSMAKPDIANNTLQRFRVGNVSMHVYTWLLEVTKLCRLNWGTVFNACCCCCCC